jgi:hypothetical protein
MMRMATMTVRAPIEPSSERSVQRHAGGKMPPLRGTNRGKSQSLREDRFYDDGRLLRSDSSRFLRLLRLSRPSNSGIARLDRRPERSEYWLAATDCIDSPADTLQVS